MNEKNPELLIESISTTDSSLEKINNKLNPNDIKKSLAQQIRESVSEIVSISSIHGIPNIMATKRILIKYMWLVFILTSSGVCSYFVSKTIADYLNYDVVSLIDIINEQYSEFPTISFCTNTGGVNFDIESSLLTCLFNNDASCAINPTNYFEIYADPLYGICYRFNSGKNLLGEKISILNSTFGGNQFGFRMDLKIPKLDYLDFTQLILRIHNKSDSMVSIYNDELIISSGTQNYISIKRIFNQKLDLPYNHCYKDLSRFEFNKTIINFISKTEKTYSQKECLRICTNLKYLEESNCDCKDEWNTVEFTCLYKMFNINRTLFDCAWNYYSNILKISYDVCAEYCPLECDSILYTVSFSSIFDYPSSGDIVGPSLSKHFSNFTDLRESFFSVQIFYENLDYELITQQAKTLLSDLIPNIGGVMGLFLGTSFLSFVELFEWVFEVFFVIYEYRVKLNKIKFQN